eukprot:g45934.t1
MEEGGCEGLVQRLVAWWILMSIPLGCGFIESFIVGRSSPFLLAAVQLFQCWQYGGSGPFLVAMAVMRQLQVVTEVTIVSALAT